MSFVQVSHGEIIVNIVTDTKLFQLGAPGIKNYTGDVVFLDIDGVLNSYASEIRAKRLNLGEGAGFTDISVMHERNICPINWSNFLFILENTSVQVVLSSSWRKMFSFVEIKELFAKLGMDPQRLIDYTPQAKIRHDEIGAWLDENPDVKYKILDDCPVYNDLRDQWVKCDQRSGLTYIQACEVIEFFNPDFKEPVICL